MATIYGSTLDDIMVPTSGNTYNGGAGADTYILSAALIPAGTTVVLSDTEGTNKIQLTDGLTIASSTFTASAAELTLSNGAKVQILSASNFSFDIGANATAGDTAATPGQTFAQFAAALGVATLPTTGSSAGTPNYSVPTTGATATPTFSVAAGAASVGEGATATFTVTLSAAQVGSVSIPYTLEGTGGATLGTDTGTHVPAGNSGTLTFAAGEMTKTVTVPTVLDTNAETGEGVKLTLGTAPTGTAVSTTAGSASVSIAEVPVTYAVTGDTSLFEGATATYTITASRPVDADTTVGFKVMPGNAAAANQGTTTTNLNDFASGAFNTVNASIAKGQTTATYTVTAKNDALTEFEETFTVDASVAGATTSYSVTLKDGTGTETSETITLTDGIDVSSVVGTSGNDTYIGTDTTYTTGDNIAAGAGTDRLNLTITADTAALVDTSALENFFIRTTDDTSGGANGVNASGWDGVEQVWNDRSTANLSVENLTVLPTIGMINGSDTGFLVDVDATAVDLTGDADAVTLVTQNAAIDMLTITDGEGNNDSVEVVTIQNTGNSAIDEIVEEAGTGNLIAMSSLTVTGTGSLDLQDAAGLNTQYAGLTTVNSTGVALTLSLTNTASTAGTDTTITSTGADDEITVVAAAGTATNAAVTTVSLGDGDNTLSLTNGASQQTVSVTTGAGADDLTVDLSNATVAGTASVTSGAGDDTVSITSDAQQILTVDLGAGDDVLTITTINTTDAIDGGEGTDTLRGTSANLNTIATTAAQRATLDNFEQLAVSNLLGNNFNLVTLGMNAISLEVIDTTEGAGGGGLAANRTVTIANNGTVSLDLASVGGNLDSENSIIIAVDGASGAGRNSDVVNFEINAEFDGAGADSITADMSVDYVETLNITTTASLEAGSAAFNGGEAFVINVEDGDRLATINVNAELATTINEDGTNFTALNVFNAADSTGGVTVSLANATQGVVATGGAGADVFTGSGFADEISMGAGADQVTGGAGADDLTGGAGDDQFIFATGDSTEADMDAVQDYQAAAAALDNDTLVIDSSNDNNANADADAILSVGADIVAGDTVQVHAADADGNLIAGDLLAIVTDGILTLSGTAEDRAVIDTLGEWIDVAELALASYEATVGTDATDVAEYAIAFEFDGNTYVVSATDGNGGADIATDDVIQLVGVIGIVAVDTTAAANTILIG